MSQGSQLSRSVTLLPCPFCGGKPEFERTGSPRRSCIVRCTNCGCHHESSDENEESGESWNSRCMPSETKRSKGIHLTELEREMVGRAIGFVLAGEWPWEPYMKREGAALTSALTKISEST